VISISKHSSCHEYVGAIPVPLKRTKASPLRFLSENVRGDSFLIEEGENPDVRETYRRIAENSPIRKGIAMLSLLF
jgi:hypothetical protein